ncbi:MAG: PAS domain S-box protein, partial [Anaerolineales bacterium]|nr:PAS domain S-box protein [Anaerolineales bacterium]
VGRQWLTFLPEAERSEAAAFYARLAENPHTVTYDRPFTDPDGSVHEYAWTDIPVLDAAGAVLEFQSIGVEVTERKRAERELREREIQLRGFLEATPDAIVIVDPDGRIILANVKTETLFGYSAAELPGLLVEQLLPAPLRGRHPGMRAGYLEAPQYLTTGIDREIRALRKDGSDFPAEISLSHHTLAGGDAVVLCAIRDVTQRRRSEALVAAQRDLARLVSAGLPDRELWEICLQTTLRVAELDSAGLYLFNADQRAFELVQYAGVSAEFAAGAASFAVEAPNAQVIRAGQATYLGPLELGDWPDIVAEGLRSLAALPIQHNGHVLGCLTVASRTLPGIPGFARTALETVATEISNLLIYQQTEKSLRNSREQLSHALTAVRMGSWRWHIPTDRASWSPEAARLLGVDVTEASLAWVLERIHPDDQASVWQTIQVALAQRAQPTFQFRMLDAHGQIRWIRSYGHVEQDADGRPLAFTGLFQDITDRKQVEDILEAEAVRRRILFDEAPDGIVVIDPQTAGFVEINATAHLQLGYTREEFAGRHLFDIEAEETAEATRQHIAAVVAKGKSDFEILQRTKQGELRNVHVTAQIVEIAGQPVYYCTWRDITDRSRAEAAQRESDERYHLLFQNMAQGVVFQDSAGHIVQANRAAEQILGLTFDQMQGRTSVDPRWHAIHEDGSPFPGEDHPAMVALRTGALVHDMVMGVFNPEQNAYRWININAVPRFLGGAAQAYQVFTTFEDITLHKQAEKALRDKLRLQEQLEKTAAVAPVMLHIFKRDAAGHYSMPYASAAMDTIYGLSPAAVAHSAEPIFQLIDPEDVPLVLATIDLSLQTLQPWHAVFRLRNPRQGQRWLEGYSTPVPAEDGSTLWYGVIEDITERQEAEARLRESEQKYRELINNMNDSVWVIGLDARILDVNRAATAILGYTREELLAMSIPQVDGALTAEQIRGLIHALPSDKTQVFETRHSAKDGRLVPVEVSSSLATVAGQTVIVSIARDITERKQADAALRQSQAALELAQSIAHLGSWEFTVGEEQARWSREMFALFARDPAAGAPALADYLAMIHPDDRERLLREEQRAIDTGELITIEYRSNPAGGPLRHFQAHVHYRPPAEGQPARLSGTVLDITDRKRAEDEVRLAERRYRALIENAPDGIVLVSAEGRMTYASPAGAKFMGYRPEAVLELDPAALTHPADLERVLTELTAVMADPARVSTLQYRFQTGTGEWRWVESTFSNLLAFPGVEAIVINFRDIHERKLAEEALHRSQALLTEAQRLGRIGHMEWNGFDSALSCSDQVYAIFGWPREAVITQNLIASRMSPGERERILALDRYFASQRADLDYEYRIGTPAGADRWIHQIGKITYNDAGAPTRAMIIVQDVTERRQAEEALKAEQTRLAKLADTLPGAITTFQLRPDGALCIPYASKAFEDVYGIPLASVAENIAAITARIPPEQTAVLVASITASAQTLQPWRHEYQYEHPAKGLIWLEGYSMPVRDADGSVLWHGFATDITSRKRVEAALRTSEERFRTVADFTYDLEYWLDEHRQLLYISPACERVTGYPREAFLADPLLLRTIIHPADCPRYDQHAAEEFHAAAPASLDFRILTAAGEERWINHTCQAVFSADGQPRGRRVSSRDITQRKRAEDELRASEDQYRRLSEELEARVEQRTAEVQISRDRLSAANAALEKAARLKDEFLASMSHELRTPLTGILGLAEALQLNTYGALTERQNRAVKAIEESGQHLLELINDILDLSKIVAGMFELIIETFALADVCQAALQLTRGRANKKRHQVNFSMTPPSLIVRGDARRLKQILVNLLSNAVKFTPAGGALGLEVQASEAEQVVRLTVWDKGIGIDPANLTLVFQPFIQLDSQLARQYEGTGLGLALVLRMAELHGGSVEAESALGQGSRFTIRLPWTPPAAEPAGHPAASARSLRTALVLEDRDSDVAPLLRYLSLLGIEASLQPLEPGAVEAAARARPDVILLDLNRPDTPGWDVLAALQADARTRAIPAVICSAAEQRPPALAARAAGRLAKPLTFVGLRAELSRLVASPAAPAAQPEAPAGRLGVMIVEDNEVFIETLADFLRTQGFRPTAVRSGAELLAAAPDLQPDMILMDVQMPAMDGLEAIRRVRAHPNPAVARVPIIALTALAMTGDRERCLAAGANGYLSKPVKLMELLEAIHALLPGRRPEAEG